MTAVGVFLSGMITAGYLAAGLFFLRFWVRSRDLLFAMFAAAFGLLALSQAVVGLSALPREEQSWAYLVRFAAFALIAVAILQKNAAGRRSR
jgi:uncharacterized protein DUF5985